MPFVLNHEILTRNHCLMCGGSGGGSWDGGTASEQGNGGTNGDVGNDQ